MLIKKEKIHFEIIKLIPLHKHISLNEDLNNWKLIASHGLLFNFSHRIVLISVRIPLDKRKKDFKLNQWKIAVWNQTYLTNKSISLLNKSPNKTFGAFLLLGTLNKNSLFK